MNEEKFRKYLRGKGKKHGVVERNCKAVNRFAAYLQEERNSKLPQVSSVDIEAYVDFLESNKESAKGPLYALMNYFRYSQNKALLRTAAELREERTKESRKIFAIKDFLDIDQEHLRKLASIGIKNVEQMLEAGKTKAQRKNLSEQLAIPGAALLELVKLSDITRLGYVKTKLSRLYYNAGLDSPGKIARFEPDELHAFFTKFVEESGWEGMVPNPKDLVGNIASARRLEDIVEE
jgi:hypothetical protein